MSEITVRPYEPRDQEQTWHVRAMTYNDGRPIPVEEQVYKTATPFVGEVDGKIVGTFVIMDMTVSRGVQAAWKTGGIAGVAVLPEARQSGVGSAMMRWSLRYMRDHGYTLAALYPFRQSYYRRFGYETCGLRVKVTCPNSRLPKIRAELPLRMLTPEQHGEIRGCYDAFAKARAGMNLREPFHWDRVIGNRTTVYAAGSPVEAYALVEHDWQFWIDQPISEIAWTTVRGYEALLSLFGSIGINKSSVSWCEPADGLMLARYDDQGVTYESEKPVMYRVLDFPGALTQVTAADYGEFTVAIDDPDLPDNNGPWQVVFGKGKTEVRRSGAAELTLDHLAAVQALLGQPSLDDLVRNGRAPSIEAARRLLPPLPVCCMDYF